MTSKYNINNFTKISFMDTLFGDYNIFDYKFIMYWLPVLLYLIILTVYIVYYNQIYEFVTAFVAGIIMYIIYFITDISYQFMLCKNKNKSYFKLMTNSFINAALPSVFIIIGYSLATIISNKTICNMRNINNIDTMNSEDYADAYFIKNNYLLRLYNIHINNIIVSIFFYIFSIFYNNPLNKKKCINNKLC